MIFRPKPQWFISSEKSFFAIFLYDFNVSIVWLIDFAYLLLYLSIKGI